MAIYKIGEILGQETIFKVEPGRLISFSENPLNSDWVEFQQWLAEGNTPEPWQPEEPAE